MNATQLKQQSDTTFFDNDQGLINPGDHRAWNNNLIGYLQTLPPATFTVDSDATLTAWANATPGNDYRHVLIKPGGFVTYRTIDLEASGTRAVTGMAGSEIVVTGTGIGMRGWARPQEKCLITGVNIEVFPADDAIAFYQCSHLVGCSGKIASTGGTSAAFLGCGYLSHCTGRADSPNSSASAFADCRYLDTCWAVNGEISTYSAVGFRGCTNLTNCLAEVNAKSTIAFSSCSFLVNCTGISAGNVGGTASSAFNGCFRLVSCQATGKNTIGEGYGFRNCRRMMLCVATNCKTLAYHACFMSVAGSSVSVPVADTAAGGYNE